MANHQEQQDQEPIKKTQKDEGFMIKNAYEMAKKPSFSSSLAAERAASPPPPPPPLQDFIRTDDRDNIHVLMKINESGFTIKNDDDVITNPNSLSRSLPEVSGPPPEDMVVVEESGRERLKRHRVEMAGRVGIPDIWGHEDLLKDWIDCTEFDSSLGNKTIMLARAALVKEGSSTLRIENRW